MKVSIKIIAAALLAVATLGGAPGQANAGDYCREYTRSVSIGGARQQAYGTACLEPDGAWRIADENIGGNYNNNNSVVVIHDGPRQIYQPRVRYVPVYSNYGYPRYAYQRPYNPPHYYRPAPVTIGFNFYDNDRRRDYDHHDRNDNWQRGFDRHWR